MSQPIANLDPQRVYRGRDITNLGRTVYRSLVAFPISEDPVVGNTPVPDLATDTGTSYDGGRRWSFTIKAGVTWQDDRPITCEDFRYGASRVFATDVITGGPNYLLSYLDIPTDPDTGLPAYTGPYTHRGQRLFDRAITCDRRTITYRFARPWPDFPLAVAALHTMDPYRRDKDAGARSKYQIFSNGPYRLEEPWSKDEGGTLVRNESYTPGTDSTRLRRALPDRITFEVGVTPELQYDRLVADHGIDRYAVTGDSAPPSSFSQIDDAAEDRAAVVDSPYVVYLAPNMRSPTLADPVARRALALATDAEAYVLAAGGDRTGEVAESIVNPAVVGYRPNPAFAGPDSGDPEAARQMLVDAGMSLPVAVTLTYTAGETADKCAAALKDTWDRAGFDVTLDGEGDQATEAIQRPDTDADVLLLVWGADWPSAMTVTPPLFDSRVNLTSDGVGQDYGSYDSDEFNALVDEARDAGHLGSQTAALQRADLQLGADLAYIPVSVIRFTLVHGSRVANYITTPASGGYPDLGAIGLAG
ncbi:MAG TPA: ABC transporter substrate-binding protein [Nocardioides sp.]|nr:ABC transporter substrate-binding protein [Nocardioides sp.]